MYTCVLTDHRALKRIPFFGNGGTSHFRRKNLFWGAHARGCTSERHINAIEMHSASEFFYRFDSAAFVKAPCENSASPNLIMLSHPF
jgi:hypothetical protein